MKQVAALPTIIQKLRLLYQRDPIAFQTLNFETGTQQNGHSDAVHFHCLPHRFLCGAWIAMEDTDAENGPLFYYPGGHKLPIVEPADMGWKTPDYKKYIEYIGKLIALQSFERKEIHMKKGQALLWAANLIHGGSRVLDRSRTRYSQVTHYFFENCIYYKPWETDFVQKTIKHIDLTNIATGKEVRHIRNGEVVY